MLWSIVHHGPHDSASCPPYPCDAQAARRSTATFAGRAQVLQDKADPSGVLTLGRRLSGLNSSPSEGRLAVHPTGNRGDSADIILVKIMCRILGDHYQGAHPITEAILASNANLTMAFSNLLHYIPIPLELPSTAHSLHPTEADQRHLAHQE